MFLLVILTYVILDTFRSLCKDGIMIITSLFVGVFVWFASLRLATYLQYFQQEEYDGLRFWMWWWEKKAFDRKASFGLGVAGLIALFQPAFAYILAIAWLVWRGKSEPDVTQIGKKPLIFTVRARRIWLFAHGILFIFLLFIPYFYVKEAYYGLFIALIILQILPLFLVLINLLLSPVQWFQNRQYLQNARHILARLRPTTVSISGAFGKTSTKYFLAHILSGYRPTLISPGSTNTPLGLARVIREQLQPHHAYFLAEMGSYKIGSIAKICELFPPDICATTAIGAAHYERFKSIDAVAQAEFEVIDAILERQKIASPGLAVLSIDCIPDHLWQSRVVKAPHLFRLVSSRKQLLNKNDFWIRKVTPTSRGLHIDITHLGKTTSLQTPVFGATMAPNLATAFALATLLGVPTEQSAAALKTVQPAPHRLHVKDQGSITMIDDSYNSNPEGFITALETLTLIATQNGTQPMRRRILVTPGMVELGELHDYEHKRVGDTAAEHVDVALVIMGGRIPTFVTALEQKAGLILQQCESLSEARAWLAEHGRAGDVVLLENDLPDRYEARWDL